MSSHTNAVSALVSALLAQDGPTFWLPRRASDFAPQVDRIFYFIFWVSLFFFLLIVTLMVIFVVRYRRRPGQQSQASPHHNLPLEITWSAIPIVLVGIMFYLGFSAFMEQAVPPLNTYEIRVVGQKWSWQFEYPATGYVSDDLHVPVGRPIELTLTSRDVIHSLFVPVFRLKKDAVPGRYTKLWFQATDPGVYPLYCAEYCGTGHSDMSARVVVHEAGEFEAWLEQASNFLATMTPAEGGERLYQIRGCRQCHNVDGTAGIGPTFKGLFGHPVTLRSGEQLTADENYIRQSILEPNAQIVAGFEGVMPRIPLKDEEIDALIAYIKTLSE